LPLAKVDNSDERYLVVIRLKNFGWALAALVDRDLIG
jgi:hypothetical protein